MGFRIVTDLISCSKNDLAENFPCHAFFLLIFWCTHLNNCTVGEKALFLRQPANLP